MSSQLDGFLPVGIKNILFNYQWLHYVQIASSGKLHASVTARNKIYNYLLVSEFLKTQRSGCKFVDNCMLLKATHYIQQNKY